MTDIQSLRTAYAAAERAERDAWASLSSVRQDICSTMERAMFSDQRNMSAFLHIAADALTFSDHAVLDWHRARDARQAAASAIKDALEKQK